MICPMCEGEVKEGAKSCGTCGYKLSSRKISRSKKVPNSDPHEEKQPFTIWKEMGCFSLKRTDIIGFIGLVIGSFFAWFIFVLWIPYRYAGHRGAHIFIPLFILRIWSRYMTSTIDTYVEIATYIIYIAAWVRIHNIIKRFEATHTN